MEILQEASLQAQRNVCVDGSLRNVEWYSKVFDDIRKRFPRYRIALLLIGASKEVVYDRVRRRAAKTQRFVPEERILESLASLPRAMAVLVCVWRGGQGRGGVVRRCTVPLPPTHHTHTQSHTLTDSQFTSPRPPRPMYVRAFSTIVTTMKLPSF